MAAYEKTVLDTLTTYKWTKHDSAGTLVGEGEDTAQVVIKADYGTNPDEDHRPKPSDLLGSMTSRGPFSRVKTTCQTGLKHTPPFWNSSGTRLTESWEYRYLMPLLPPLNGDEEQAATQHLLRVRNMSDDFASDVAEFNKAADGFSSLAKTTVDIWKRVKGKSRKKLSICDVASTNLAVNYGIKPVVSSASRLISTIERSRSNTIKRVSTTKRFTNTVTAGDGGSWRDRMTVKYVSYIEVDKTTQTSNLNLGNPVEWAWELIPYSFVVDWMVNVGDTIAAHNPLGYGLTHKSTCKTVKHVADLQALPLGAGWATQSKASGTYATYWRTVEAGLPAPSPIQVDVTQSLTALGNAVSLLVTTRGKC
jgi:hypothetical protein